MPGIKSSYHVPWAQRSLNRYRIPIVLSIMVSTLFPLHRYIIDVDPWVQHVLGLMQPVSPMSSNKKRSAITRTYRSNSRMLAVRLLLWELHVPFCRARRQGGGIRCLRGGRLGWSLYGLCVCDTDVGESARHCDWRVDWLRICGTWWSRVSVFGVWLDWYLEDEDRETWRKECSSLILETTS